MTEIELGEEIIELDSYQLEEVEGQAQGISQSEQYEFHEEADDTDTDSRCDAQKLEQDMASGEAPLCDASEPEPAGCDDLPAPADQLSAPLGDQPHIAMVPGVSGAAVDDPLRGTVAAAAAPVFSPSGLGAQEIEKTDETDPGEVEMPICDGRPVIKVADGNIPEVLVQAQVLLRKTGQFFTNGAQLVQVHQHRVTGDTTINPVKAAQLSVVLSQWGAWLTPIGRKGEWKRVDAPTHVCTTLLQQHQFDGLDPLVGLARQPFLRDDGSVSAVAGYDRQSGVYGAFQPSKYPVAREPSRPDAEAALGRLDALLDEFPFATETDRSAALAAMLTAAIRPSLAFAPMFLMTAPGPGTGKTFLCQLIAAFASARECVALTLPGTDSECAKVLLSQLRRAPATMLFDNLGCDLPAFDSLCAVLTSSTWSGRVLNTSTSQEVSTRALILASGNNVRSTRDMTRRCITISLDAREELPAARRFNRPNLVEEVLRHRGDHVADALTVVRAWIGSGDPVHAVPPLVTFDRWGSWCRQPLLWLGKPDPVASVFTAMQDDPDRQMLKNLLGEWQNIFKKQSVMVRDLVEHAGTQAPGEPLRELLTEISGDGEQMNRRRIGRWIAAHANQIAGSLRIQQAKRTGNAEAWQVMPV